MIKKRMIIIVGILVLLISVESASTKPWTIIDAVQNAISNHPQALIAESLVDEARGERRNAIALPAPFLATRWDDIPSQEGLSDFAERRICIEQDFEFPLRYIWLKKAADVNIDLARNESLGVLLDLESEVRLTYLEAWASSEKVKVNKEYRDSIKTCWSNIQVVYEHGGISRLDVRKSRVEAARAENELRASQRSRTTAFEKLSRITDYDLTDIELISPLVSDPVDTTRIVESNLFASSPEVLAAQAEVGISGYEKTLASTAWLPEIELTYFHRQEMLPDDTDSWAFQLELSLPVWFWLGGASEVQTSKAQLNRAKAELETYRIELISECLQLTQELKSVYEQYKFYQGELLPLARDEYQTVHRSFQLGDGTYIDLIDAQDDLRDTQQDNIDIILELYEKKIFLDRLSGKSIGNGISKSG
ncbi:MAG: TolC family protein [Candidatus Hatepunaea meridiana]|nr:TolC family protein [Candidatus Hatepunaea meridiana]